MRVINVEEISKNIKEMCIEANYRFQSVKIQGWQLYLQR